ncbi:MAG: hypothetical protein HKN87_13610 [Saprospiraceae bacterium]|nr:hypothetical protein [Saprospiraceae bacterium]
METDILQKYSQDLVDWLVAFAPKQFLVIPILVVGMWLIKRHLGLFARLMERAGVGAELSGFFISVISIALKFVVILLAAGMIGFQVSSLLGVLVGSVFAIGLALQGFSRQFCSWNNHHFFQALPSW